MDNTFLRIANPSIRNLSPYVPGKPASELQREHGLTDITNLANNENPLGPSPKALLAIQNILGTLSQYPDGNAFELKKAIASKYHVDSHEVTIGNGSDNLFSLITQAITKPGTEVLLSQYGYTTYYTVVRTHNAQPTFVPMKQWRHDLEAIASSVSEDTGLIFLANPNNPTGSWITQHELIQFLEAIPERVLVVIDEAYCEYMDEAEYPNTIQLQKKYSNLITTRTFSKAHALAGLRVAYSISHPDLAELFNRVRLPFNVSSLAQAAAIAAINDESHINETLKQNRLGKIQLQNAFDNLGLVYLPPAGNFITIDLQRDSSEIYQKLFSQGIIVKPLRSYHLPNHLRITIGNETQNTHFIKALSTIIDN